MSQARARTRSARSGVERTNHEATAPHTQLYNTAIWKCPSTQRCCCPGYANYPTASLSDTIELLLTLIQIYLIKLLRRTFHNPVALVKLTLYLYWKQGTQQPIQLNWCDHNNGKMAASFERHRDVGYTFPLSEL